MMERRELYQPEDIEQLLLERSYDELLDEERAFVLQHLNGRSEYEHMRALLLRMHVDDGRIGASLDADPGVRDHLMAVFHAQQQPRWRIWLNSSLVWLAPREAKAMWRPALAFGSLAALVLTFVLVSRSSAPDLQELAQVHTMKKEHAPVPQAASAEEPKPSAPEAPDLAGATRSSETTTATNEKVVVAVPEEESALERAPVATSASADVAEDLAADEAAAPPSASPQLEDIAVATPESHEVTKNELFSNMSTAATRTETIVVAKQKSVRSKERKADRRSTGNAQGTDDASGNVVPQELLGVLRAAW